jgi:hypothetical protein
MPLSPVSQFHVLERIRGKLTYEIRYDVCYRSSVAYKIPFLVGLFLVSKAKTSYLVYSVLIRRSDGLLIPRGE